MRIDAPTLLHDVRYFAISYAIAIGAAFLPLEPVWLKWIVAVGLVAIYAWYVRGHFVADPEIDLEDLAPLRFHRLDAGAHRADPQTPRLRIVYVQVAVALGCIVAGAIFFVDGVEQVASALGIDELLLALVVAPIATELPEKFNSIIWVRQNKDTLSMGNITGAMVFQSTIPTFFALVCASSAWHIGKAGTRPSPRRASPSCRPPPSSSHWLGGARCGGETCWSAVSSTSSSSRWWSS